MNIPTTRELRQKPAVTMAKQKIAEHVRSIDFSQIEEVDDVEMAAIEQAAPEFVMAQLQEQYINGGIIRLRLRGTLGCEILELSEDECKKYQGAEEMSVDYVFPPVVNRELLQHLLPVERLALAQLAFAKRFHGLLTDWKDRNRFGKGKQQTELRRLEARMDAIQERYDVLFDIVDPKVSADSLLI